MNLVDALVNVAEPIGDNGGGENMMGAVARAPGLDRQALDFLLEHAYRRGHADGWDERDSSAEEEKRATRPLIVRQAVRRFLDYLSAVAKGMDAPALRDVIEDLAKTFDMPEYIPDPMPSHRDENSLFTRPEPPFPTPAGRPLTEEELVAAAADTASAEGAEHPAQEHAAHVTGERGWPEPKVAEGEGSERTGQDVQRPAHEDVEAQRRAAERETPGE